MVSTVAVVGASGRMGRLAIALIERSDDLSVFAEVSSADPLDAIDGADIVLDLTVPGVSATVVDKAVELGIPILVGTSGWNADRILALERTLQSHPNLGVIIVPNFSVGSVLATRFATLAAPYFESIEIVEAHAATKIDSPSGTATRTAELMAAARIERGPVEAPHSDQRARGQQVASIPVHSLRMEGVNARQDVMFGGAGEVLTITHETLAATSYEAGILLGLRAVRATRGVVVGLDSLLGLGALAASPPATASAPTS